MTGLFELQVALVIVEGRLLPPSVGQMESHRCCLVRLLQAGHGRSGERNGDGRLCPMRRCCGLDHPVLTFFKGGGPCGQSPASLPQLPESGSVLPRLYRPHPDPRYHDPAQPGPIQSELVSRGASVAIGLGPDHRFEAGLV